MSIESVHPLYSRFQPDWVLLRDAYEGERVVKAKGTTYLPATAGQIIDGMGTRSDSAGQSSYNSYLQRAVFPDIVPVATEAMLGIMHNKPPKIELPAAMEPMREKATVKGESLNILLRRINLEQIVVGRMGLLLDVPNNAPIGKAMPYIAPYRAEAILNWDDGRREELVNQVCNLVVLDESEYERKMGDFEWDFVNKYRVLVLGEVLANEPSGSYRTGVFRDKGESFSEAALIEPSLGGRTLLEIPFVFINSKDLVPEPDTSPMIGLARQALTVYRGEADYRQGLFMQAQDTLVIKGEIDPEKAIRAGAGAAIRLPAEGDAKFIGTNSSGLPEMRMALENDRKTAADTGGRLLDTVGREAEAAEALRIRVTARTATLNSIAMAGALGLQQILRMAAVWMGLNPEEVIVEPNLDFADNTLDGQSMVDTMTAKAMGYPLSLRSIHRAARERNMTEYTFEEEMSEIETEAPLPTGEGDDDLSEDDNLSEDDDLSEDDNA